MKLIFPLLIHLLLMISCRSIVQEEFPDFTETPVLNCILRKDSLIKVHISLTGKIDTNKLIIIDNASVNLFTNDQFIELLNYAGNGIYTSGIIAEPGQKYAIEVSIPGLKTVYAHDSLPEPSRITKISHIKNAGKNEEGLNYPAVKLSFTNDIDKRMYYEVIIKWFKYGKEYKADLEEITDQIIINEGLPLALFSNEMITDSIYETLINYTTGSGGPGGMNLYPLMVELRTVSYSYYKYVRQLYIYEKGRYPDNMLSSNLVISTFSNITGGYGIFAGYSSVQTDIIFP